MNVGGQSRQSEEYDDPHMAVGLQDGSSSSMPSNMLSMGEDLVDMRRPHGARIAVLLPC